MIEKNRRLQKGETDQNIVKGCIVARIHLFIGPNVGKAKVYQRYWRADKGRFKRKKFIEDLEKYDHFII